MEPDTVRGLLGNGAITLVVLALVQLYQKLRDNRTTLRAGLEAREQLRYDRDASWNNNYRSAAEAHLLYDSEILALVAELRQEIQHLRSLQGLEPKRFSPLPKAPPLFPEPHLREKGD